LAVDGIHLVKGAEAGFGISLAVMKFTARTYVYQKVPRLSSTDRKQMALGEYLRYDLEMATSPLSVPSGFAV
jgi:hypothetical protein